MKAVRDWLRRAPIPAGVAVMVFAVLMLRYFGKILFFLREGTLREALKDVLHMAWPIALAVALGKGWIFKQKGLGRTLLCGLIPLLWALFTLFQTVSDAVGDPQTQWRGASGVLLWVLEILQTGILEEVIYRGIIANAIGGKYITGRKGLWLTLLVSAVLFGLSHMANVFSGVPFASALYQSCAATFMGILLCTVYFRGGSLWGVILLHALLDAPGLFGAYVIEKTSVAGAVSGASIVGLAIDLIYLGVAVFLLRGKKGEAVVARFTGMERA